MKKFVFLAIFAAMFFAACSSGSGDAEGSCLTYLDCPDSSYACIEGRCEKKSIAGDSGDTGTPHDGDTGDSLPGEVCGNGTVSGDEICDDGDLNGTYGHCRTDCTGIGDRCGDGIVQEEFESCDDGELNGTYGHCKTDCSEMGEHCGDGVVQDEFEKCDEGEMNGLYNHCDSECKAVQECGDSIVQEEEECDEGSEFNGTYDHCRTDCSGIGDHCGDGILQSDHEVCDDGPENGTYGKCNELCKDTARCGDGITQSDHEKCDSGEANNGNYGYCKADCSEMGERCGDGIIQSEHNEICDNGDKNGTTACAYGETSCTVCTTSCAAAAGTTSYCGDGNLDAANGENCDNGADNGKTACAYGETSCTVCSASCIASAGTTSYCGDGILDEENGEVCDDGADNGTYNHCRSDCSGLGDHCGDGIKNGSETCDDGADNGKYDHCNLSCSGEAYCGDGEVNGPETCDDGGLNNTYGHCKSDCSGLGAHCGDGIIDAAAGEECEPDLPVEGNCTDFSQETTCTVSQKLSVTTSTTGTWTVPETGYYKITLAGAQGGNGGTTSSGTTVAGGKGAVLTTVYKLTAGQVFYYALGAQGGSKNKVGGGGGASYIGLGTSYSTAATTSNILLVAGGGGGAANTSSGSSASSSPLTTLDSTGAGTTNYGGGGGGLSSTASGIGGYSLVSGGSAISTGSGGSGGKGGGGAGYYEIQEDVKYGCDTFLGACVSCSKKDFITYNGGGGGGLVGGNGGSSHFKLPGDCTEYGSSATTTSTGAAGKSYRRENNAIEGITYINGKYAYDQTGAGKIVIERVCANYKSGPVYCNRKTCRKTTYLDYNNQCVPEEELLNPPMCGNDKLDAGEVCEVSSYSSKSCDAAHSENGIYPTNVSAHCNTECTDYDYMPCQRTCGNGTLDSFSNSTKEECDTNITMPSYIPSSPSYDTSTSREFSNLRADSAWNIYVSTYSSYEVGSGLIRSLVWTTNGSSSRPRNMKIYLKTADNTTLNAQTWESLKTGAVLVYDHDLEGIANGVNEFVLDTKYAQPAGKALIAMVVQHCDTTLGAPSETLANAVYSSGHLFLRSNSSTEPLTSTVAKSSNYNRPLLIFKYEIATAADKMTCEDYGFTGGELRCSGCTLTTEACTND